MTLYKIALLDWTPESKVNIHSIEGNGNLDEEGGIVMVTVRFLLHTHKYGSLIQLIIWNLLENSFNIWFGVRMLSHWNAIILEIIIGNFRIWKPKSVCLFYHYWRGYLTYIIIGIICDVRFWQLSILRDNCCIDTVIHVIFTFGE